jgi:mRNA-degrading endonuclease RelE of RelBE toxin-antitoxin system
MSQGAGREAEEHWSVAYSGRAEKDIARLDPPIRQRVLTASAKLAADPASSQLRKLTGSEEWRMRVGEWRVRLIRDEKERVIYVTRVLPPGRAYDR